VISAAIGAALFLPHLPITFQQMSYKGIGGWLDAPKPSFLFEWIQGVFNYHSPTLLIFGSLILIGFIRRMKAAESKFWLFPAVFGAWFLLVFAVGYAYSVLVDPLLHQGSLFFAAPFLVIALAAIASPPGPAGKMASLAMAVLLSVSLVFSRDHYTILKSQPYATIMRELGRLGKLGDRNMAIISQTPEYLTYYGQPSALNTLYINRGEDSRNTGALISNIAERKPEYLFTDGTSPTISLAASQYYNHIDEIQGFTFTGMLFSNSQKALSSYSPLADATDTLETRDEFVPIYTSDQGTDGITFADEIGGLVHFAERPAEDVILVVVFSKGGETVGWTGGALSENAYNHGGETILPHQILIWNTFQRYQDMRRGVQAKIYLWNPGKTLLKINRRQAFHKRGNPNMYGQLGRRP
jgi:hypothetical protein